MKNKYKYSMLLAVVFSTGFSSPLFGQTSSTQKNTPLSGNDPVLTFQGTGFDLGTRMMNLSALASQSSGRNETLKENTIAIGKDGMYQITVSGNIHQNDNFEQKEEYIAYINGKECAKGFETPGAPTGVFSFVKTLKKGDVLSIGTAMNDERLKKSTGTNLVSVRLLQN
jgi:hypothetical protein